MGSNKYCISSSIYPPDLGSLSINQNFEFSSEEDNKNFNSWCRRKDNWGFPFLEETHSSEHRGNKGSDSSSDNEIIDLNASLMNEEDQDNYSNMHKDSNNASGQSKLCARGHWRPAEDTKLKELVALYGPQNWNLIAEKLEGRSGKSE